MMKKIFLVAALFSVLYSSAQTNPCGGGAFPTIDSLGKYINKYVRNSAINAFTDLRLNTALIGVKQWLDCARSQGIDSLQIIDADGSNPDTLKAYRAGVFAFYKLLPAGGGTGSNNANVGTGFRILNAGTQEVKTLGNGLLINWDSATTGQLRPNIDTANLPKTVWREGTGVTFDYTAPSTPGDPDTLTVNATGSGEDSSTFATRYFVINNRSLNFAGTSDSLFAVGDSYVTGQGASTGQRFSAQVAANIGKYEKNLGIGGTGARAASIAVNQNIPGYNNNNGILASFGFNDYRANGSDIKTLLKNKNAWHSILASAFLSDNSVYGSSASITRGGTWGEQDIGNALGGKSTKMGGQAVYAQATGNTLAWTFTGDNLAIGTIAYSGTIYTGGAFKVQITNVGGTTLTDTVETNDQTDGVSDGYDFNLQTLMAKVYWDLGNNSHTVTITTLDANTVYIDYIGVLNGQTNCAPVLASLIPKMKSTSYALSGPDYDNATAADFDKGDSIINLVANEYKARNYPVATVPVNDFFDAEDVSELDPDLVHPSNTGYDYLTRAYQSVIEPYSYSGIPIKDKTARIRVTPYRQIVFSENLSPNVNTDYFGFGRVGNYTLWYWANPSAPADSRLKYSYIDVTDGSTQTFWLNDANTSSVLLDRQWKDSSYKHGVFKMDSARFGGEMQMDNTNFFQVGRLPGSLAYGFELRNPTATVNQRIMQWFISGSNVFTIRGRKDDNTGAGAALQIPLLSGGNVGHAEWSTPMHYTADYAASMTTDRYIPDKGMVSAMIAAAGSGVTTMGAFGSSPNSNGASISGNTLTLQPADATNPGGWSTGTQTLPGNKTLTGNTTVSVGSGTAFSASGGATGASLIGTSTGVNAVGNSWAASLTSPATPLLANNSATSAGMVLGANFVRNGAYTGANNDGLEIKFSAKNSAGTNKEYAFVQAALTNATNAAEDGAILFKFMTGGGGVTNPLLNVSGRGLELYNGTTPTVSVVGGVRVYSENVGISSELKVRDEAGNITTISPHNFTGIPQGKSNPLAWAFYSEKDGKYINVDMFKLAELVEKLTGEKLIYTGDVNNKPNTQNK